MRYVEVFSDTISQLNGPSHNMVETLTLTNASGFGSLYILPSLTSYGERTDRVDVNPMLSNLFIIYIIAAIFVTDVSKEVTCTSPALMMQSVLLITEVSGSLASGR